MLFGRFVPLILVLALAGAFAGQRRRLVKSSAILPTHGPMFVGLVVVVVLLVGGLSYFPVLAVGPIADGLAAGG